MTCPFHRLVRQPIQRLKSWENTNLDLSEDRREKIPDCVIGSNRPDDQQRGHSEKSGGFDEHGGDGLVQSADSIWRSSSSANVPCVQDESDDDHQGEDDVE